MHNREYVHMGQPTIKANRVPKCDVIKFSFFAFQHVHDHISAELGEKPSHTKFDMNWFMVAQDMDA